MTTLEDVARRLFWWESNAQQVLSDERRFLTQVLALGTWNDVQLVMSHFGEAKLKNVLNDPYLGYFDRRSWTYWHVYWQYPVVPPLPKRQLHA